MRLKIKNKICDNRRNLRLNDLLFLLLALAAAALMVLWFDAWMTASARACPDPNNLDELVAWLIDSEPNAQAECLDYWYPAQVAEPIEPEIPQYEPQPEPTRHDEPWVHVPWSSVPEPYRIKFMAWCTQLGQRAVAGPMVYAEFHPNSYEVLANDLLHLEKGDVQFLNTETEIHVRVFMLDTGYGRMEKRPVRFPEGDYNRDGVVDLNDFAVLSRTWLNPNPD